MPFFSRAVLPCFLVAALAQPVWAQTSKTQAERKQPAQPASLDGQALFEYMLAEVAASKGEWSVATEASIGLARRYKNPLFARRAAEIAARAADERSALEAARIWTQAEPESFEAAQTLAWLQARAGSAPRELEPVLARMLEKQVEQRAALVMQLPRAFGETAEKAQVLESVMRLTTPYLKMPEAWVARSTALLEAEQRIEAHRLAREALRMRPGWERAALQIVQTAPRNEEQAAMEELGRFGNDFPQSRLARTAYVRWLAAVGRLAEAKPLAAKLAIDYADDLDIGFMAVQIAVTSNDAAMAEPLIRSLIEKNHRESGVLRIQLGQELEKLGRPEDAINAYALVEPGKDYFSARSMWAALLTKQKDLAAGRKLLADAAAQEPDKAARYLSAESELLVGDKQYAEAASLLERGIVQYPDDIELVYQAGMVAERQNRIDAMERYMRTVIAKDPSHAHAYNALGYTFADRNMRLDEAESLLLKAVSLRGEDAAILDSVGWLYFRKGNFNQAISYLQRSYAKLPDQEVAAHLVEALFAAGRTDEARRVLDTAIQRDPASELLKNLRARLYP